MLFRNWKFSKKMAISFQVLSVFICFPVVFHSMLLVHLLLLCSLRFVGPSARLATGCYCCFFYNCLCFLLKLMNPYGFLIKIRFDQYLSPAQPANFGRALLLVSHIFLWYSLDFWSRYDPRDQSLSPGPCFAIDSFSLHSKLESEWPQ